MKNIISILIFCLSFLTVGFCQKDSTKSHFFIKTPVCPMFINKYALCIEYVHKNKWSVEASGGKINRSTLFRSNTFCVGDPSPGPTDFYPNYHFYGYDVRFYFKIILKKLYGTYAAIGCGYRDLKMNTNMFNVFKCDSDDDYYYKMSETDNSIIIYGHAGKEFILFKHCVIDLYAGVGLGKLQRNIIVYERWQYGSLSTFFTYPQYITDKGTHGYIDAGIKIGFGL